MKPGGLIAWVLAITASVLAVVFATFLIWTWYFGDFSRVQTVIIFEKNLPPIGVAAVAVCIAAIPATFITRYFRSSRGDIEFSGLGIKFKGPAGPILLWVVSFLAVAVVVLLSMRKA